MNYEEKSDWTPGENEPNSKPISKQFVVARPRWPESAIMAHLIDIGKIENGTFEKLNLLQSNSLNSSKQYFPVSGTSFAHLEHMR
jgi:hypothetical protein